MRTRLLTAPIWVLAPLNGLVFALAMVLSNRFVSGASWSSAVTGGAVGGLVFGAFMAPVLYRQRRRFLAATGELPAAQIAEAARASLRGPVPADPAVRAAAARLSAQQGELLARQRVWGVPFFALMTVGASALALTDTPWWWVPVLIFGVLLWFQILGPGRYRRRAQLLGASAAPD